MAGKIPDSFGEGRSKMPQEDLSNTDKIRSMMFPGSTISHTLITPNESQKKLIKHKYDGTSEWDWRDPEHRKAAYEYDSHPEVQQRRWDAMTWDTKLMCGNQMYNEQIFYGWNMALTLLITRSYFTSVKGALLPWVTLWGGVLYFKIAPEQR